MKQTFIALAILLSFFVSTRYSDAQTANVLFHQAAKLYIAGNFPEALRAVESGLQRDPANPKLHALRDKIEEEMKKQLEQAGSNQQEQQQQNEQKQDQQENQQQQNQPQDEKQKQSEQQQQAGQQKMDKEQLSKEDAARLLEALRNQEKEAQKQRQAKVQGRAPVEKDW